MNEQILTTVFNQWHKDAGGKMVSFGGFEMPIQYTSIFAEHLATRKHAGLFDISHMGRFLLTGKEVVDFLQYTLTNNVKALTEVGTAQYTLIPDEQGGAIDDAYLYRHKERAFMLVVNAANRRKDWEWLSQFVGKYDMQLRDISEQVAMISLQGPQSQVILQKIVDNCGSGYLPDSQRNRLATVKLMEQEVVVARTGYTGEPVGFEIFPPREIAMAVWERLLEQGKDNHLVPVGLGARDTLRLEAGYPLYGHELGLDPQQQMIPIFALPLARSVTRFEEAKGEYIGRKALYAQYLEMRDLLRNCGRGKPLEQRIVKKVICPIAILNKNGDGPGISSPRPGFELHREDKMVGWITSGSPIPNWHFTGDGLLSQQSETQKKRAIGMAYVDSDMIPGEFGIPVAMHQQRGKSFYPVPALLVKSHLRAAAPYARPVVHPENPGTVCKIPKIDGAELLKSLVTEAIANHHHRQTATINLIPSEQTPSCIVKSLSVLDPVGRYAEHKRIKAFGREAGDIFYYQGTGFIGKIEEAIQAFFRDYLDCSEVEAKVISGQLANASVFAGLVDYYNRFAKEEKLRLRYVFNNHLRKGGHLSAQTGGALKHFVRKDPETGSAAVVAYPISKDNPYKIDLPQTGELIHHYRPQLVILGKSMVLHPEPVKELAKIVETMEPKPFIMYDAAHVLGLFGPHFQQPFAEGADIVTGSTHKTFFGTQRGVIASNMSEDTELWPLWNKIMNNVFPGSLSNHHLGTMLGLLGACYEMMEYGYGYQQQVILNAKAFAKALADNGLCVEGDASIGYTQTHQVLLRVPKAKGPETAINLEKNNILVNYQGLPDDSGFSDASGIRMGTQEMTRFGMKERDFAELAGYMADLLCRGQDIGAKIAQFRQKFLEMHYCMDDKSARDLTENLRNALFSSLL